MFTLTNCAKDLFHNFSRKMKTGFQTNRCLSWLWRRPSGLCPRLNKGYLTLFYAGGGHICPPYHISAIFSGRTYPRRLQLYSKFKFCNYQTHKFGPGSKKFSYGAWEPAKVGWVVDFLLHFASKLVVFFPSMKWDDFSRWNRTLITPSAKDKK